MSSPCSECGRINVTSPSDYFCSDVCQQHWYAKQTTGYPVTPETILPSQVATVAGRWRAA
jgi:hypothetical protein